MTIAFPSVGAGIRWLGPRVNVGGGGTAAWIFLAAAGLSLLALMTIALSAYYSGRMPSGPVSAATLETLTVPAHTNWPGPLKAQDIKRR